MLSLLPEASGAQPGEVAVQHRDMSGPASEREGNRQEAVASLVHRVGVVTEEEGHAGVEEVEGEVDGCS